MDETAGRENQRIPERKKGNERSLHEEAIRNPNETNQSQIDFETRRSIHHLFARNHDINSDLHLFPNQYRSLSSRKSLLLRPVLPESEGPGSPSREALADQNTITGTPKLYARI